MPSSGTLKWQWLSFTVIAVSTLFAYYPSLLHVPRGDQIGYLAEVAHKTTWGDLAAGSYDLNRTRFFAPGDELLFRPVMYAILGTERFFFRYHFLLWQAAGLAAHLAVVWQLLRLLLTIRVSLFAPLAAGFFSLMFMNMEMVVWHHITSYMVFVWFILTALRQAYAWGEEGRTSPWSLAVMGGSLLLAAFTYEAGGIYAALTAVYLWIKTPPSRRTRGIVLLAAIPLVYLAVSFGHLWVKQITLTPDGLHPPVGILGTLWHITASLLWWLYSGLFPTQHEILYALRNMLYPEDTRLFTPLALSRPEVLAGLTAAGSFLILAVRSWNREWIRARGAWWSLLTGMIVVYAGIIALGRVNPRGLRLALGIDLYYNYMFWVWAVILFYSLVSFDRVRTWISGQRWALLLAGCLAALTVGNGMMTHRANEEQARLNNDVLVLTRTLDLLIAERGRESGFSFDVAPDYPGNYIAAHLFERGTFKTCDKSLVELLYPEFSDRDHPRYRFRVYGAGRPLSTP